MQLEKGCKPLAPFGPMLLRLGGGVRRWLLDSAARLRGENILATFLMANKLLDQRELDSAARLRGEGTCSIAAYDIRHWPRYISDD